MRYWKLVGTDVVEVADLLEWAAWFEKSLDRYIAVFGAGKVRVSTVFLGIDHNWSDQGPPLLFETMIFGGKHDGYQVRTATYDEALAAHRDAVQLVLRERTKFFIKLAVAVAFVSVVALQMVLI